MSRLVIMTEIISPYRIPLFNSLAERSDPKSHVIFLAETDPVLRQWNVYKDEIGFSFEILPSWRRRFGGRHVLLNRGVSKALNRAQPDVILCGGYNYPASWRALWWARSQGIPFLLWSESNARDMRGGHVVIEALKSQFLRRCSGFVVPGKSAWEYLSGYGTDESRIFTAVNAVDNDFFSQAAGLARENAVRLRRELDLPNRYFLFTGRLVREKGIFELLSAYGTLDATLRREFGLVFVGDGPARREAEQQAVLISPGVIRFVGFAQREQLPTYYGLAEMLILPTYTDTWGLVVNEAMACGLPIILSDVAGCAPDLVMENWNGKIVPPRDVAAIAAAMREFAENPGLCVTMGMNSSKRIADYSPYRWSEGIAQMVEKAGVRRG
jgi:1,2-diacylglycerol 3-alpha-glucosyltransferase